jgi:arsenite transporter
MWNKISFLNKYLIYNIPAVMILGVVSGYYGDPSCLKIFIIPLTFLMVYPMMINLQIKEVFSPGDGKVQLAAQIINFVVIPFVAFAMGRIFFSERPLVALGLLLAALLPTSGMTISWTGFAKGNINAAIKMTVIGLIAGSLATPIYAKWLMGTVIAIPLFSVFRQIALIVFLPMAAGYVTQRLIVKKYGKAKYHKDIKKKFPAISTIGVLGIVFVAMALKSKTIVSQPADIVNLLVPLVMLYFINFTVSTVAAKLFFNREDGIALVYGTVMRNLSIALAIAMTVFGKEGSEIAMIIALSYVIQVQSAAWYVKLTTRIFGPAAEDRAADIMEKGVFALYEDATINDAVRMLDEEHIHSIAVLNAYNKPAGMLTAESIINLLAEKTPLDSKLGELKLVETAIVGCDMPINQVINKMKRTHEYKVLVTDKNGKPKGVLTEMDILHNIRK